MVQIAEPSPLLPPKRWTVADYRQMIAAGVLTPDDRVELLDGQIIEMVPQEPPHASTTDEGSDYVTIRKKLPTVTLEALLASIPENFEDPSDVRDFVDSPPMGQELI